MIADLDQLPDPHVVQPVSEALARAASAYSATQTLCVVDQQVDHLYGGLLREALPQAHWHIIPSGEAYKTLASCEGVWSACHRLQLDRKAMLLAIGGGMALDLVGWCAATWKRGIACGYLPTTLLAMVDAAHGGKVGVDFHGGKNLLGAFVAPAFVICATEFLGSLPERELRAGFAEVLKHALIGAPDAETLLATDPVTLNAQAWLPIVQASADFKLRIVRQDPREQGLRQILNFGHTVGHALESTLLDTPQHLLHGEAVALGMAVEAVLSAAYDEFKHREAWRLVELLRERFPLHLPPEFNWDAYQHHLWQDKKNQAGELRLVTLGAIGQANYGRSVPMEAVLGATREVLA